MYVKIMKKDLIFYFTEYFKHNHILKLNIKIKY